MGADVAGKNKSSHKHLNARQIKLLILTLNKSIESFGRIQTVELVTKLQK